MKFIEELKWRNSIKDVTNEDIYEKIENEKVTFYIGFDPTGDSLHVGSLLQIVNIKRMLDKGHQPIILTGGFTGLIGDPSGKAAERNLLTHVQVIENEKKIRMQLQKILNKEDIIYTSSNDWWGSMNVLTFLREYGKMYNISEMIKKDIVSSRLDKGISFTEFSYQILQGVDWLYLYKNHNCIVQFGGSDQWGNLTSGTEAIRKSLGSENKAYGITTPLVTKSDGTKFGKSETGTVWLDDKKTTPYQLYQFFFNTNDSEVIQYLKYFTFLGIDEINALEAVTVERPFLREAQKTLAAEVVKFVHGEQKLTEALNVTNSLFKNTISSLNESEIEALIPALSSNYFENKNEIILVDALIEMELASSRREGREFLKAGAIRVNDTQVSDENYLINKDNALFNKYFVIKRGKKLIGAIKV